MLVYCYNNIANVFVYVHVYVHIMEEYADHNREGNYCNSDNLFFTSGYKIEKLEITTHSCAPSCTMYTFNAFLCICHNIVHIVMIMMQATQVIVMF